MVGLLIELDFCNEVFQLKIKMHFQRLIWKIKNTSKDQTNVLVRIFCYHQLGELLFQSLGLRMLAEGLFQRVVSSVYLMKENKRYLYKFKSVTIKVAAWWHS